MKRNSLITQRRILMLLALLLSFCFIQVNHSHAQEPTDLQWYIWNGQGRIWPHVTTPSGTTNRYFNPIGTTFQLENVTNPNRTCHPKAKNELFIIYADSTYFNSREEYNEASHAYDIDLFYPDDPAYIPSSIQYYRSAPSKTVKYLYMTSKYEEDDPPIGLRVISPSTATREAPVYELRDTTQNAILTANHNVVENKDITLIINLLKLRKNYGFNSVFYLRCDSLLDAQTRRDIPRFNSPLFDPINVFNGNPIFPSGFLRPTSIPAVYGLETNILHYNYLFINLRPNGRLTGYYPNGVDTPAMYAAIFELLVDPSGEGSAQSPDTLLPVTTLTEAVLRSHDPNFVRRESICESNHKTYIYYHVEFQNTSFHPANNLMVELKFPDGFMPGCLDISSWRVAGEEVVGTYSLRGNNIILKFPPDASCMTCAEGIDPEKCKGSIDFCIRTTWSAEYLLDPALPIKPEAYVSFGSVRYPLHNFIDPVFNNLTDTIPPIGPIRTGFVTSCSCDCSFICLPKLPCIRKPIFYAGLTALAAILAGTLLFSLRKKIKKITE